MSSTKEKALAAGVSLVMGITVWISRSSWAWGVGASFAVYVVMMLDNILDRLDKLDKPPGKNN